MIHGHMVTRNEAHRYLESTLQWLNRSTGVDDVLLFDDQSTDDTMKIAARLRAWMASRVETHPSFLEHEARFREAGWAALGQMLRPTEDDWIVVVDADEWLIAVGDQPVEVALADAIKRAGEEGYDHISVKVAEIFDMAGSRPMVRTDGQWGVVRSTCICRWQPRAKFADKQRGCGRVPKLSSPPLVLNDLVLLHAGYRRPEDRQEKAKRYAGAAGHGPAHVQSILKPGSYEPWSTPLPPEIVEALTC